MSSDEISPNAAAEDERLPATAASETARPSEAAPPERALQRQIRGPLILGLSAMALFFLVGGLWSGTAPLSGAVIASGVVSPESSRQTVQHLEGGIIREIRVQEGQHVQAGVGSMQTIGRWNLVTDHLVAIMQSVFIMVK